jgi:pimeloyl-ACP methyl ester carboxylesterase
MFARLNSRGIPAPYLLVGASYAAFTQLIFASQWRDAVVGMILLDPSHPRQGEKALATLSKHQVGASESIERFRTMLRGFGPAWEDGCRQVSAVDCLGSMPLTVIAAGAPEMPDELAPEVRAELIGDRHNLLTEYCKLTERGEMRIAEGIGHDIARLAPELALDSVRRMLALVGPAKKK